MSRDLGQDLAKLLALLVSQAVARAKAGDPDLKELVAILERGRKHLAARKSISKRKGEELTGLLGEGVGVLLDRVAEEPDKLRTRDQLAIFDLAERCLKTCNQVEGGDPEEGAAIAAIRRKIRRKLERALDLEEEAVQ